MTTKDLINKTVKYLRRYAPKYNISVYSPILAQLLLESAKGTSELAVKANNYFGLKYKKGRCPTAIGIYEKYGSEQLTDGSYQYSRMQWCKFKDLEGCVVGYLDFINASRYSNLKHVTDPKEYLEKIKADGYATSLNYVSNLLRVIGTYNLTEYDPKQTNEERSDPMGYTNSSLICYTKISPNKTSPRNQKIDTITIHCMAGNLTVERCGEVFAKTSRKASSNYGIGTDGRIAMYVEEKDRSWCSSNKANDMRAVTIEVANDGGADTGWHVSDKAMASLIKLVADICKRNDIKELKWSTNKSDRINHKNGCNMTVHRDFAAKSCPGNYLYNKHGYIAAEVNKLLGINSSSTYTTPSTPSSSKKYIYDGLDYSLVFDPTYYANNNSDVKKAFGTNANKLFNHFKTYGMKEGRQATSTFNVIVYKNKYADLQKAFGDNLPEYYKHYIQYGKKENRQGV